MPYKFNMLRDTLNMGGDSEEQADKQAERERIVESGDLLAIKKQALADQWEQLNRGKSFGERMANLSNPTIAQEADMQNTMGLVTAGSLGGVPSAGAGSALKSLKGIVPSTGGRTAAQAAEKAAEVLSKPGMARSINQAALSSNVPQMSAKILPEVLPESMSLLDRIKLATMRSK